MNRGKKSKFSCQQCNGTFIARVADRLRGWAKFCSKSCKASNQEEVKKVMKVLKS